MFEREAEVFRVEVGSTLHVGGLVPDTVQSANRTLDVVSSLIREGYGSAIRRFHGLLHESSAEEGILRCKGIASDSCHPRVHAPGGITSGRLNFGSVCCQWNV